MKKLSYKTLQEIGYDGYLLREAPERILQFGEGNFLRAFTNYFFDLMNERAGFCSKAVLVQPIRQGLEVMINEQEGLYTLYLRGIKDGKEVTRRRVISSVSRCLNPYTDYDEVQACAANPDLRYITCNTTEAGICYDPACRFTDTPAESFPGKLTQFLYRRFEVMGTEAGKGLVILSCELIDDNGQKLRECVLKYADQWKLGAPFRTWICEENLFCSTLVDRIVTGYPKNTAEQLNRENGYQDSLMDTAEIFGLWVIEGPEWLKAELPFDQAGLPVLITADHTPYKQRKVRILNGAHTAFVLGAYLSGREIVRECLEDEVISAYLHKAIYEEIIPTLTLPKEELKDFAAAVFERFKNPFIDHALLDISLNGTAKWKARVLPSLKQYADHFGRLPVCLTASFAFYIAFYRGLQKTPAGAVAKRNGQSYPVRDEAAVIDFFCSLGDCDTPALVHAVCRNLAFWDEDLSRIDGFEEAVLKLLQKIDLSGAYEVMKLS